MKKNGIEIEISDNLGRQMAVSNLKFIEQFRKILQREQVNITALAKAAGTHRTYIYTIFKNGCGSEMMERLTDALSRVTGKKFELTVTILETPTDTKYWVDVEIGVEKLPETAKN